MRCRSHGSRWRCCGYFHWPAFLFGHWMIGPVNVVSIDVAMRMLRLPRKDLGSASRGWRVTHLFRLRVFGIIIQELRWSQNGRGARRRRHVPLPGDICIDDRLMVRGQRLLDCFTLAGRKIEAKFVSLSHELAPGMAVTSGELIDELLDAGFGLGNDTLPFALP